MAAFHSACHLVELPFAFLTLSSAFPFLLCFFLHLAVVVIAILVVVVVVDIAYFRAFRWLF